MTGKVIAVTDVFKPGLDQTPPPAEKLPPGTYLQYMGFGQLGTVRQYRFRRIARGEETREYLVDADLALFAKYHVGIQEGPGLCLHLLLSERSEPSGAPAGPPSGSLTESHILAHLADRRSREAGGTHNALFKKKW